MRLKGCRRREGWPQACLAFISPDANERAGGAERVRFERGEHQSLSSRLGHVPFRRAGWWLEWSFKEQVYTVTAEERGRRKFSGVNSDGKFRGTSVTSIEFLMSCVHTSRDSYNILSKLQFILRGAVLKLLQVDSRICQPHG